jgi:hypothetical protein
MVAIFSRVSSKAVALAWAVLPVFSAAYSLLRLVSMAT